VDHRADLLNQKAAFKVYILFKIELPLIAGGRADQTAACER
jgi:hypothetical protein